MISELAQRHGTPLYVYQLDRLHAAAADLRDALPVGTDLYYSVKANPHPRLVAELAALGLGSEISSTGELFSALTAGQRAERCLYTGPGKTLEEIKTALDAGVRRFSMESVTEYHRLAGAARARSVEVEYLVRLNGNAAAGGGTGLRMTGASTQFGLDIEAARSAPWLFRPAPGMTPIGFHVFPATNVSDPRTLAAEFELSITSVRTVLDETGFEPRLIDLGGGFAAPFAGPGERPRYPELRETLTRALDTSLPGWTEGRPRIAFESGRYLAGDCGTLLTTVLDVKESGGRTYVVLDAGTNTLGGMAGLGRVLAPSAQPEDTRSATGEDGGLDQFALVGPLCTPLDVLHRSARMTPPWVGEILSIPNVGAYGLTASLVAFLGRPMATEVVLATDGTMVGVRRLELREMEMGK
ncbi:type III PLP-dependent enzyme [Streptomyces chromofuscus]|uniref:type III PLP-dependent enzyme n=1 Tax=Streptomyces chromofuscus TaxID=42881 RepID=UPI001677F51D|nr:type III PLP-dependent enzyme [Streptomyces chromofuscus]GGT43305.1 diaminopimelate decarboxylase [Streptomyces chromofuscus]